MSCKTIKVKKITTTNTTTAETVEGVFVFEDINFPTNPTTGSIHIVQFDDELYVYEFINQAWSLKITNPQGSIDEYLPLAGGTMEPNAQIIFDNNAGLQEGTTDAGAGGGIALRCAIDYELKWEAGALYVLNQDGFTIRVTDYRLTAPSTSDDSSKGFIVGSIWRLDNGAVYTCTDDTVTNAVWGV